MSGGGGETVQKNEPPKWMLPYMQDIAKQGASLYQGFTPQYFPGSGVAPQSPYTQQAIGDLGNFGNSPYNQSALTNAQSGSQALLNASDPNVNPVLGAGMAMQPGNTAYLQAVQQRATGQNFDINAGPSANYQNQLDPTGTLNRLQGQNTSLNIQNQAGPMTGIEGMAQQTGGNTAGALNSFLTRTPGSNPYTDELVQRSLGANTQNFNQSVMPQISNASQAAGGYGGTRQGIAQGVATQGLTDANARAASGLYSQQYNQDLANQLQATGLGAQIGAQGSQTELARIGQGQQYGLQRAGLENQVQQQDLSRQLAAAGQAGSIGLGSGQLNLAGQTAGQQFLQGAIGQGLDATNMGNQQLQSGYAMGQQGAGQALAFQPALQQMGMAGIGATGQAGAAQDAYQQQVLQDMMNRWNFGQQTPYNKLQQYQGAVTGSGGGQYGTQTQPGGGSSPAAGAVGGAATGAGAAAAVASSLGTAGAANFWNPYGWAMVGAGALLGSGYLG